MNEDKKPPIYREGMLHPPGQLAEEFMTHIGYYGVAAKLVQAIMGGTLDTKQERLLRRLDAAEKKAIETAERRANSPEVAAAERKRQRKADKLRRLHERNSI